MKSKAILTAITFGVSFAALSQSPQVQTVKVPGDKWTAYENIPVQGAELILNIERSATNLALVDSEVKDEDCDYLVTS